MTDPRERRVEYVNPALSRLSGYCTHVTARVVNATSMFGRRELIVCYNFYNLHKKYRVLQTSHPLLHTCRLAFKVKKAY